jgi:hypothetical protein
MSEKYQCHIIINNRTSSHLKYDKSDLPWGKFTQDPVADIQPKSEAKAFVATGAAGTPTGCEGTVLYRFLDDANVAVTIYYDVPFRPGSNNTIRVSTSNPDVAATLDGFNGCGSIESCTVKVVDGR